MILNSQPQVSYALMDLMVKINAVNMEVFQVPHPSLFPTSRSLTAFVRKPYPRSVHPKLPSLQHRHQCKRSPPDLRTLSNSSNSSHTQDTPFKSPVHPRIQTIKPRDTLLSFISNPLWPRELKYKPP